ncbi:MAG: hypothetical protein JXB47_02530 [Anaerolineae bacterium]|nr:hypothetical protein [Anaerolineae bacterium]
MSDTTRVADLTVEELLTLLRAQMQDLIREAVREALKETLPASDKLEQRPPLDLPVFDVGPWPEGLTLSREDMYGDDRC